MAVKKIIHVNQHKIKKNRKNGTAEPVLAIKTYKSNIYANEAIILDRQGSEIARVVYRPDNPLKCGAECWIESIGDVLAIVHKVDD